MAVEVMKDALVKVNNVDLSAWVKSVTLNYNAEVKDTTAMGVGSKQRKAGLIDWSVDIEFNQDYALAAVDASLFALIGTDDVPVAVRPNKTNAISTTNPEYQGVGVIETYQPMNAEAGEVSAVSMTIQGSGVLTRDTSP